MKSKKILCSVLLTAVLLCTVVFGLLSVGASAVETDPDTTRVLIREADGNDDGSVTDGGVRVFKTVRGATAWADTQAWGENAKLRIEIDQDSYSTVKDNNYLFVSDEVGIILREDASPLPIIITGHGDRRVNLTITSGSSDVGLLYLCNDYTLENMNITTTTQTKLHASVSLELKDVTMSFGGTSYIAASAYQISDYYLTDTAAVAARRDENGELVSKLILSGNTQVTVTHAYATYAFSGENKSGNGGYISVGDEKIYYTELNSHIIIKDNAVLKGNVRGIRNSTYLGSAKLTLSDNATVTGYVQGTFNRNIIAGTESVLEMTGGTIKGNLTGLPSSYGVKEGGAVRFDISGGVVLGTVSFSKTATTVGDFNMNISGGTFAKTVSGDSITYAEGANVSLSGSGYLNLAQVAKNLTVSHEDGFSGFDKVYVTAPAGSVIKGTGSPAPIAVSDENGVELRGGYLPIGASVVLKERISLKIHFDKALADLYAEKVGNPEVSFRLGDNDLGKSFADAEADGESYVLMLPATGAGDFDLPLTYSFDGSVAATTSVQALAETGVTLYAGTVDEALFKALVDYGSAANGVASMKYFDPAKLDLSVLPDATDPIMGQGKVRINAITLLMGDAIGIRFKTESDLTGVSVKVNGSVLAPDYYSAKNEAIDLYVNAEKLNEILTIEIYDGEGTLCASFGYAVSNINALIYAQDETNLKAAATLGLILAIESKLNADVYVYPLDTLPAPTAAIDSYGDGAYVADGNRFASLISLEDLAYNRVTIQNGSQNGDANANFAYTFLAEEPVLNEMPVYAKGYSYVVVVEPVQSLAVDVPEDAKYLYVYHHTENGKYYFPDQVTFSNKKQTQNSFELATWNIGNFANGGKNSTITDDQLEEKQKLYTDFIENRLNADLICLNEFDPYFTTSETYETKDVLFSDYVDYVGTKSGYQCNSMFAKQNLAMTAPVAENFGNGYGYYTTDITVGGKTVTVVSVHLNYDHDYVSGTDEINKEQILDVLEIFAEKERVIFLGDWNCIQFEQYELLSDAGYTVANTDPDLWTKTGGAIDNHSLDNIAYKGVTISNFTCEITDLSDHYALTCTVSVD